jgi:cytochrome bd-type quinol oxidase subunit 1
MRHLTFYYSIGFAVAGLLMLIFAVMTFAGISQTMRDPWNMAVLVSAMILPFVISTLSWRDWGQLQKTMTTGEED